jgi:hypothetical protein
MTFRTLGTPADIWAACTVTLSTLERTHLDSIVNDNYRILEVIEACGGETADAADAGMLGRVIPVSSEDINSGLDIFPDWEISQNTC